jgi:hypothetical protein
LGDATTVEEVRTRLREKLEEAFGVDEATMLMDRPPGGWDDLVTNQTLDAFESRLDLKLAALKFELLGHMEREFRAQTWRLVTAILAAMGSLAAAMGVFAALARL